MGWWFGRKSAPADARPFVPWSSVGLDSAWPEEGFARSYEAQFEEVYRRNPVGQRAVRLLAGMLGSLTVDGDARALRLIKGDGLLETVTANLLLHGNAYVQLIADGLDEPSVAGAVEQTPVQDPPSTPGLGACYILGSSPTGAWAGKPQYIAGWTSGGWRLVAPVEGMSVYVKSAGQDARYHDGGWELGILRGTSVVIGGVQVVGGRAAAIAAPTGGTTVDAQARNAVNQILAALVQHGLIAS